ncbi:ABL146Cp [Eremothecium gossypii ATCC 10895]|uniref:COP9 signalosome complex subunit 5 n=1 Tax=Eremothecium gossypii (strain ATCC 10895 / CBS 109.51 / FGSC 9923 / NRRL Y-1056) TaxID=284811 RepID=CSN5_EREGS|nr:ABL146Cp [Eremothecium gossypii ATCC 10895]Q75E19.1 RecName: Full=COP9 signalosome complex subunit 5 [Eremothecium gossypii ATCC 10895]AAS50625.1 ABL146Cp [Eremothecium gossypii ATCC 10895]AEY94913.1 FABL146Cp [Eremothecium gossypii FDAG1]
MDTPSAALHRHTVGQLRKLLLHREGSAGCGRLQPALDGSQPLDSPLSTVPSSRSQVRVQQELWKQDPTYFQKAALSALACMKILRHAFDGGDMEVLGMLLGYVQDEMIVVVDSYRLPVEGTETRVNAQMESYEYTVQYLETAVPEGLAIVGWYHSHPGYGCWLSGIDAETQTLNQNFQDPYLAIVVDPKRSKASGVIDIGAFRTMPETADTRSVSSHSNASRYGHHSARYYELEVSYFEVPQERRWCDSRLSVEPPKPADATERAMLAQLLEAAKACKNVKRLQTVDRALVPESIGPYALREQADQDLQFRRPLRSFSSNSIARRSSTEVALGNANEELDPLPTLADANLRNHDSPSADMAMDNTSISSNEEQPHLTFQESSGVQLNAAETEYFDIKNELLTLKLLEYQKARFYRDAFTL